MMFNSKVAAFSIMMAVTTIAAAQAESEPYRPLSEKRVYAELGLLFPTDPPVSGTESKSGYVVSLGYVVQRRASSDLSLEGRLLRHSVDDGSDRYAINGTSFSVVYRHQFGGFFAGAGAGFGRADVSNENSSSAFSGGDQSGAIFHLEGGYYVGLNAYLAVRVQSGKSLMRHVTVSVGTRF